MYLYMTMEFVSIRSDSVLAIGNASKTGQNVHIYEIHTAHSVIRHFLNLEPTAWHSALQSATRALSQWPSKQKTHENRWVPPTLHIWFALLLPLCMFWSVHSNCRCCRLTSDCVRQFRAEQFFVCVSVENGVRPQKEKKRSNKLFHFAFVLADPGQNVSSPKLMAGWLYADIYLFRECVTLRHVWMMLL